MRLCVLVVGLVGGMVVMRGVEGIVVIDDEDFLRGDVNADGFIDQTDAINIQSYLYLGTFHPGCLDACDTNDDGFVDNTDVVVLLNCLYFGTGPLPDPNTCGADPTMDDVSCEVPQCWPSS